MNILDEDARTPLFLGSLVLGLEALVLRCMLGLQKVGPVGWVRFTAVRLPGVDVLQPRGRSPTTKPQGVTSPLPTRLKAQQLNRSEPTSVLEPLMRWCVPEAETHSEGHQEQLARYVGEEILGKFN